MLKQKKKKIEYLLLTIFLIATIAIPLSLPTAISVPTHHKATHPYIGATPNPIGVGQETLIHVGITDELENVQYGWKGLTVTVTKPDQTTATLGPFTTDSTGGTGYIFTPDQVGTYYLQTNFPAQWFNWSTSTNGGANIYYEASTSEKLALNVSETQPTNFYEVSPLPTEYWTRPVNDQLRDWYQVAGEWLQPTRNEGPYVPNEANAPDSSHVLWAKPLTVGGLVGNIYGTEGYENGDAYEGLWGYGSPVIMGGIVYYNNDKDSGTANSTHTVSAVDQHSGEELWSKKLISPVDNRSQPLQFGQIYSWNSYNYQGAFSYIWTTSGTTWNAFDPFTGEWEYSMTNVPSGTQIRGPNGEILIYTLNAANGWMTLWNSTRVVSTDGSFLRNGQGTTFNCVWSAPRNGGYEWNVSVPKGLPGAINVAYLDNMVVGSDLQARTAAANVLGLTGSPWTFWAINVKAGQAGQIIYNKAWQPPAGNLSFTFERSSLADNVFTVWSKELRGRFGFNLQTGTPIWGPTEPEYYLQTFGLQSNIAYGKLYSTGYGGHLYAYDLKTGNRLWDLKVNEPYGGSEVLWSNDWPMALMFITDGKVYMAQAEHSANQPLPRDGPFMAVNATDGSVVFRIDGAFRQPRWAGQAGIADGIITLFNTYDNQIYSVGKGPTQTTVTAPNVGITTATTITITGSVTDISAGTKSDSITPRFPDGVAAVSDASMNNWMKYVYMQFARPTNTTGVLVELSVVDANGNYRTIGTTTSDADGFYSFTWTPDITGKYTLYASFGGSNSYYASHAVTAFNVDPAAPTATPQPVPVQSISDQYFVPAIAGVIVAIAIVGAVLALLMFKKKP
jgi:hypothetical protein